MGCVRIGLELSSMHTTPGLVAATCTDVTHVTRTENEDGKRMEMGWNRSADGCHERVFGG
jgi:hypothetical protein